MILDENMQVIHYDIGVMIIDKSINFHCEELPLLIHSLYKKSVHWKKEPNQIYFDILWAKRHKFTSKILTVKGLKESEHMRFTFTLTCECVI